MKGIISERKARDKERKNKNKSEKEKRSKSVNHVGTSMNAIPPPRGPPRVPSKGPPRAPSKGPRDPSKGPKGPIKLPSRVQSMDDVKKKRPPPKRHSRKAKSLPFVQMSPPSPQTYGPLPPDLNHDKKSMFREIGEHDPNPSHLRNSHLTPLFKRMSRRFIWAQEPDVELKVEPKVEAKDPRNM